MNRFLTLVTSVVCMPAAARAYPHFNKSVEEDYLTFFQIDIATNVDHPFCSDNVFKDNWVAGGQAACDLLQCDRYSAGVQRQEFCVQLWKSDVLVTSYLSKTTCGSGVAATLVDGGECGSGLKYISCPTGYGRLIRLTTEAYDPETLLTLCTIEPDCVGLVVNNDGSGGSTLAYASHEWTSYVRVPPSLV